MEREVCRYPQRPGSSSFDDVVEYGAIRRLGPRGVKSARRRHDPGDMWGGAFLILLYVFFNKAASNIVFWLNVRTVVNDQSSSILIYIGTTPELEPDKEFIFSIFSLISF